MENFDVVVIGTGPAGEGAAMMLSKNHRKVAVVERYTEVGGGCTHWGTIPSKALRHAVKTLSDLRANPLLRKMSASLTATLPQLLSTAGTVIEAVHMRRRCYDRNRVPVLEGTARFVVHTLEITPRSDPPRARRRFVIATGSRPYHPPGLDFFASARAR
jgi:NAD(P) transhydrogenase